MEDTPEARRLFELSNTTCVSYEWWLRGQPDDWAPTKSDAAIIVYLANARLCTVQEDIAAGTDIGRKTLGVRLRQLEQRGLVHYPNGSHNGACLTVAGQQVAAALRPGT